MIAPATESALWSADVQNRSSENHNRLVEYSLPLAHFLARKMSMQLDPEKEGLDKPLRPCPDDWVDYCVAAGFTNKCDREHQGPACIEKGPPGKPGAKPRATSNKVSG